MKRWKIAWLVIVKLWSNVLGLVLLFGAVTGEGPHLSGPEEYVAVCLLGFTLPAAGLFVLFAAVAWLARTMARRRSARRPSRLTRWLGRRPARSLVHTNVT